MEFKLNAPGGDNFLIKDSLPEDFDGNVLPLATAIHVKSDFLSIIFQNFKGNGFEIWYSNYNIFRHAELVGYADIPVLELHVQFLNQFHTSWDGVGGKLLRAYQYNISYTPFVSNKAKFLGSRYYHTFDVHFTIPYLQNLATQFPVLDKFLQSVIKGKPSDISKIDRFLTPDMITIVNQILHCPFKNGTASFYIEAKVIELLLLILHDCSNENPLTPVRLTSYDIDQLHKAKAFLLEDFEKPPSIKDLSKKVALNDFKLKKGFKFLFGTSIFDYLLRERMEKAKTLLLETDETIEDIAMMTGYEFTSNFNKAFKKYFGFTAAYLRRHKK